MTEPPDYETEEGEAGGFLVRFESEGTEHEFHFTQFDPANHDGLEGEPVAWPETLIQGGESHRIGVDDVPEWIAELLAERGYPLEEG